MPQARPAKCQRQDSKDVKASICDFPRFSSTELQQPFVRIIHRLLDPTLHEARQPSVLRTLVSQGRTAARQGGRVKLSLLIVASSSQAG